MELCSIHKYNLTDTKINYWGYLAPNAMGRWTGKNVWKHSKCLH